jgi:hypothetical protein
MLFKTYSRSATVKPSAPCPLSKPLGSVKFKPRPITPATGAKVMYLFLKDATTPNSPFLSSTTQSLSISDVASLPACGPVNPKHGISVPSANRGRKYSFWSGVPYRANNSPGPSEFGTATVL